MCYSENGESSFNQTPAAKCPLQLFQAKDSEPFGTIPFAACCRTRLSNLCPNESIAMSSSEIPSVFVSSSPILADKGSILASTLLSFASPRSLTICAETKPRGIETFRSIIRWQKCTRSGCSCSSSCARGLATAFRLLACNFTAVHIRGQPRAGLLKNKSLRLTTEHRGVQVLQRSATCVHWCCRQSNSGLSPSLHRSRSPPSDLILAIK
jgi:hypothetical protein